jgi:hypothetical protein
MPARKHPHPATDGLPVARLPRSVRRLFPQVTECFDSDRAVDVHVKAIDVKQSNPLHPSECAMAHAFKRETHAEGAIIGIGSSYLIHGTVAFRFKTPGSVQREIVTFDRHRDFREGHYYLVPPSPSAQLKAPKPAKRGKKRGGGGHHTQPRRIHKTEKVRVLESGACKTDRDPKPRPLRARLRDKSGHILKEIRG